MVQFIKQWNGISLTFDQGQQYVGQKTAIDWLVGLSIPNMADHFVTIDTKTLEYCKTNSVDWFWYGKNVFWNIISNKLLHSHSFWV